MQYDLIVIGGGAAGFFAAITAKATDQKKSVLLLEKTNTLLAKVRISGGGRCNVTHNCFDPKLLIQNYPRGSKELLGPFHKFQPRDTIDWFEKRGVSLKAEADGRIFPATNSSQTIIDCLLAEAEKVGVEIALQQKISSIEETGDGGFCIRLPDKILQCRKLLLATGSSSFGHKVAESLGHTIEKTLPSLFTFNVPTSPLSYLSGSSAKDCEVEILEAKIAQRGPVLITHFGFSGPAILKLSAKAAPFLFEKNYKTPFKINWLPTLSALEITHRIEEIKTAHPNSALNQKNPFTNISKKLWNALLGEHSHTKGANLSKKALHQIVEKLQSSIYQLDGKTTHKEEFVTCGGVRLSEVNFQTMESRVCPNLYFAGEILDIDGVTGGFNFQNAWTTGFLSGTAVAMS